VKDVKAAKALVTGVAGFVGSQLAEALTARGVSVVGVDSFLDYYPRAVKLRNLDRLVGHRQFSLIEAPLQTLALSPLLEEVEVVYHLAAQAGVRSSWGKEFSIYTENNIGATQLLLEAAVGKPLRAFVYASSSSVYGDALELPMRETSPLLPVSPYGVTKLAGEMLCRLYFINHRVPTVSLRYFTVYGPRQRPDMAFHRLMRGALLQETVPLYGDGAQTRDFTFVGDAIAATLAAAERGHPGAVYNIGGGSRVSLRDVIRQIEQVSGKSVPLRREATQKGDMRDTYADTTLARAEIGYAPRVALPDGLAQEWAWLVEQQRPHRQDGPMSAEL